MSVQLLDKTRKINKLLHNNHSARVEFNDMCAVLSGILESNILVISRKGKVLGTGYYEGVEVISELVYDKVGGFVDEMLNERLLSVLSTKENVNLSTLGFTIENVKKFQALIAPVEIAGERLGKAVNDSMMKAFPQIVDVNFTANMESLLDGVADGDVKWKELIKNFYPDLKESVDKAEKDLENVKIEDEVTDIKPSNESFEADILKR